MSRQNRSLLLLIAMALVLVQPVTLRADSTGTKFHWRLIAEHLYETMRSTDDFYGQRTGTHFGSNITALETPLRHGAGYLKLLSHIEPLHGVWLNAEVVAEHRGMSYGVYPALETAVFPRIIFGVDTSLPVLGLPIWTRIRVGHFSDVRLQEGLTIYNLDAQGTDVSLGYKSVSFRLHHIGDLAASYGLNLDDLHNYLLEFNEIPLGDKLVGRASIMTGAISTVPTAWTIAGGLEYDSIRIYGSVGVQPGDPLFRDNWGSLAGVSYRYHSNDDAAIHLASSIEYRFYSSGYNARRFGKGLRYAGVSGSHSIGRYLYPLDRIDRPFSTWALHTGYQGRDVESGDIYAKGQARLYRDLHLHFMGEVMAIRGQYYGSMIYPFYDVGIAWQPVKECYIRMSVTNRAMDLYEHFPSLFALKGPAIGYTLHLEF
jgi:hypothetical protein